jgi:hypothetical protein
VNVASVPPVVSVPPARGPKPASSFIHRTMRVSIAVSVGDISRTASELLSTEITGSVQMAAGNGADT